MDKAQQLIDILDIKPNKQGFYTTGYGKKTLEGLKETINNIMGTEKHNGWSNYPTWCVNLWLTNDHSTDKFLREVALSDQEDFEKAEEIQRFVESSQSIDQCLNEPSLASDLLGASLENVDWLEIIKNNQEE